MTKNLPGKRVIVKAFGETPMDALEHHVVLEDQPAPDPATLAPSDVVIRVKSAAVGWVDLLMTSGQYQHMPKPPYSPGLEYAGTVAWTGADGADASPSATRCSSMRFLAGPRSLGAHQAYGRLRVVRRRAARRCSRIPGGCSVRSRRQPARQLRDRVSLPGHARPSRSRRDGAHPRRVGLDRARRGARREAPRRHRDRDRPLDAKLAIGRSAGRRPRRQLARHRTAA